MTGLTQSGEVKSTHDEGWKDFRVVLYRRRSTRSELDSTSDVGRRDSYIQDLNVPGINKPSAIYVFHRTKLCDITAARRAYIFNMRGAGGEVCIIGWGAEHGRKWRCCPKRAKVKTKGRRCQPQEQHARQVRMTLLIAPDNFRIFECFTYLFENYEFPCRVEVRKY